MYYDPKFIRSVKDDELIQLVQNRNESAFSELISRYTPRIWRVIIANSRQRQDAEEILTDTWVAVWDNISTLKKIESFGPWLQKIAYNTCNRYYASSKRSSSEIPHTDAELAEQIDHEAAPRFREYELRADAREAVQQLPQRIRSVAVLYYLESWSMKEIAEELDLPIGTVKTKLRETRALLRKEFGVESERGGIMSSEFVQNQNDEKTTDWSGIKPAIVKSTVDSELTSWALPDDALFRFGRGYIYTMALSPDGKHLVFGTPIGLWWYDTDTLSPITLWHTDCENISAITFSTSGEWIATGHENGSVKIWDIQHGKCIKHWERKAHRLQERINQLIFTPDGKFLAANGVNDYIVDVWNTETGKQLARFGDPELRFHVCMKKQPLAFSQDNRMLACASPPDDAKRLTGGYWTIAPERDVISVWDICSEERIAQLNECTDFLQALTFSPCGNNLVATYEETEVSTLTVWNTENWQVQSTEQRFGKNQLIPAYSTKGTLRLAAVSYVDATIWDATSHEKLETYSVSQENEILQSSFIGSHFALATTHELNVWTLDKPYQQKVSYNSHPDNPISLLFSPDKRTLVAEYPFPEGTFRCWDFITRSQKPHVVKLHGERHCLYASSDEKLHTTSVDGSFIKIREFGIETPIAQCEIKERPRYKAVAYSHEAQLLAYGDSKKNLFVWDIVREEILHRFTGHETNVAFMDFSPDGNYLASDPECGYYRLWHVKSGKEVHPFKSYKVEHTAFSPCGNVIAGETEKEFILWDLKGSKLKLTIPKSSEYLFWWQGGIAFSPNGLYLATGLYRRDGMVNIPIMVWDTMTGENIATFSGHPTNIISLAFSQDGTLLASSSGDGTILIWDMKPYL